METLAFPDVGGEKLRSSGDGTDKKMNTGISVHDWMRRLHDSAHARAGVMKTKMGSLKKKKINESQESDWSNRGDRREQRTSSVFLF